MQVLQQPMRKLRTAVRVSALMVWLFLLLCFLRLLLLVKNERDPLAD